MMMLLQMLMMCKMLTVEYRTRSGRHPLYAEAVNPAGQHPELRLNDVQNAYMDRRVVSITCIVPLL